MLLNVIKHQRPDIDKIYSYVKDPIESKYQLLINGRKKVRIEDLKDSEAFIDYPQTIDCVCENLEDYNPTKKEGVLIVLDDIKADMESNKKGPIVTELSLKEENSIFHSSQSYFKVPKTITLNTTRHFVMKREILTK